ncbi:MAG: type I methionyl aminopeptidase [Candidatus Auribacterota bacterium]|nr:type I methionyl aminopeptidase [Candidatus Auribacterota bacterium]
MIVIKSPQEIEKMRRSCQMTSEVLNEVLKLVEPGVKTEDIDRFAEDLLRRKGGTPAFKGYHGYPKSVCISINEEVVHGIPGNRKLCDGDIVSLDFGVLLDGFYGDMAVTVPVGNVSESKKKLMEATQKALDVGIAQAVAGNRLGDISHAVEQYVLQEGFSVVRDYVGHGIGRQMHEDPQIPNFGIPNSGPLLKSGMVFAIEPMVNMGSYQVKTLSDGWTVVTKDGKPSAHFEHTIVITKDEPEVITCLKKI